MRISDWSSDVCSSDLRLAIGAGQVWRDCLADCRYPAAARSVHTAVEGARRSRSRDRRNPPLSWGSLERIGCLIDRTVQSLKRVGPQSIRSEEHTSELQSLMRNSFAVYRLTKKIPHIKIR